MFGMIKLGEDWWGKMINNKIKGVIILGYNILWYIYYTYLLLLVCLLIFILQKVFITVVLISSNFIDLYLVAIISVFISILVYIFMWGIIFFSVWLIYFISKSIFMVLILAILEIFTTFFQSITLSNRFSINMLVGSLLTSLLSLFIARCGISNSIIMLIILVILLMVFMFELFNSLIQLFIFMVLSFEYLVLFYVAFFYSFI